MAELHAVPVRRLALLLTLALVGGACVTDGDVLPASQRAAIPRGGVDLFRVSKKMTRACRYSAAREQWRVLCPTLLPRPLFGSPPLLSAGVLTDRNQEWLDFGYGAPTEGAGSIQEQNRWRNQPCCFLHFDVQLEDAYGPPNWHPKEGGPASLGGRDGWLQPATELGYRGSSYFANHWRFFFAEEGEHYAVTLHDFGPETPSLMDVLVEGLEPVEPLPSPLRALPPTPCDQVGGTTLCRRADIVDIVAVGDFLWTAQPEVWKVMRQNERGRVSRPLDVKYADQVATDGTDLWALGWKRGDMPLYRVDPDTAAKKDTIGIGPVSAAGMAIGEGSIWVSDDWKGTVTRVDPNEGVVATIEAGHGASGIVVAFDSVWVTNAADDTVTRIDAATNEAEATIAVGAMPQNVLDAGDSIWVTNTGEGTVARIDPETNEVVATVGGGVYPMGMALAGGCLWIADYSSDEIRCHDPSTGAPTGEAIKAGPGPFALAAGEDALWIATQEGVLHRSL